MLRRAESFLLCLALSFAVSSARAQTTQPTSGPTSKPSAPGADLNQEVTGQPESAEDRVRTLEAQLQRLNTEVERFGRIQSEGGVVRLVQNRLQHRDLGVFRKVQLKQKAAPVRMARGVRMMMPNEKAELDENTVFLANGHAVSAQDYEKVLAFTKTYAATPSDAHFEAIVALATHAIASAPDRSNRHGSGAQAGHGRARSRSRGAAVLPRRRALLRLQDRQPHGQRRTRWLTRKDQDPLLMSAIFAMKAGEKSKDPIHSQLGLHYVEVMDRKEAGEDGSGDAVRVRHTLAMFTPESPKIAQRVRDGNVTLVFRETEHMVHARRLMAPKLAPTEMKLNGRPKLETVPPKKEASVEDDQ